MIHVILGNNKEERATHLNEIVSQFQESEVIAIDDTTMQLLDLEQFLFPSLFSIGTPIIHARFILDANEIDTAMIKKLSASPTVFVFEEFTLSTPTITKLKSGGAIIRSTKIIKEKKQVNDIFAVTACLTAKDKKTRWLAYRSATQEQPIEAILGILYWKLRTLASKEQKEGDYTRLYRAMITAHAYAWKTGAPLELVIEKIILQ